MSSNNHRELWVVRHGETPSSRGRKLAGWTDVPLTERGEAQAAALKPAFAAQPFDGVWSSDLLRALTSARLAWGEPRPDRRLREIHFGELEGADYMVMNGAIQEQLQRFEGFAAPGGESFDDMRARVLAFVEELPPGRHALFAHGGVVRMLAREVGEDRWFPTGSLVIVNWDARTLLSLREGEGTPRDETGAAIETR